MRIDNISVRGLFDRFDHDIELDPSERIAIVYGPNGFGKTMILRIVNALFNSPIRSLGRMPFREVCVDFDDGSSLDVVRDSDNHLPSSPSEKHGRRVVRGSIIGAVSSGGVGDEQDLPSL